MPSSPKLRVAVALTSLVVSMTLVGFCIYFTVKSPQEDTGANGFYVVAASTGTEMVTTIPSDSTTSIVSTILDATTTVSATATTSSTTSSSMLTVNPRQQDDETAQPPLISSILNEASSQISSLSSELAQLTTLLPSNFPDLLTVTDFGSVVSLIPTSLIPGLLTSATNVPPLPQQFSSALQSYLSAANATTTSLLTTATAPSNTTSSNLGFTVTVSTTAENGALPAFTAGAYYSWLAIATLFVAICLSFIS